MINKKIIKRILVLALLISISILTGCVNEDGYSDVVDRPTDIPELEMNQYVTYPSKPETSPVLDPTKPSTVGEAYASEGSNYVVTNGETIEIEYTDISHWSYVYLPIENYRTDLANMKITASGSGAERIAIQAVYYEMYEEGGSPITVYLGDIADGEQYFIFSFGKFRLLNAEFNQVDGSSLATKTVIGLCLFIDSNPSQLSVSNDAGKVTIESVKFLEDGDPELEDKYVAPSISIGFNDAGYSSVKDEETQAITITREANTQWWTKSYLPIANYSSSYSAFNIKFNTTGVKKFKIALEISTEGNNWLNAVDVYSANVTDGEHEAYVDFSGTQPISASNFDYVAGYYIKNYRITQIHIYLDTFEEGVAPDYAAECVISELNFERTATEGIDISRGWNAGTTFITLGDDIIAGGTGTITYQHYTDWNYLTMPVLNYEEKNKLVVKFAAPDGIDYLGIAAVGNGREYVFRSAWELVNGADTVIEEKANDLEGMVESVEYDEVNKIYTFTFDFTNVVEINSATINGKKVNQLAITALRFYFNDNSSNNPFEGERTIRFISVSFE